MTSACGVIENIDYNDSKKDVTFRFENLNARGDVFEEYYYNTESLSIYKNKKNSLWLLHIPMTITPKYVSTRWSLMISL